VQVAAFGTQAMPTLEHDISPPVARWQVRQPSDHSRQVSLGGASGPEAVGACTGSGFGAGASGRSAANAGDIDNVAARTTATIHRLQL
jgi:hypothetical protein